MIITIDLNNPKPTYLQIVDCVRLAVANGTLKPGDKLPAIREAAVQTRVNRNTVSRAYLELEHLGIVRSRQGAGCYVTDSGTNVERQERLRRLQQMAEDLALEAHHFQVPIDDVIEMVRKSSNEMGKEQQS